MKPIKIYYGSVRTVRVGAISVKGAKSRTFNSYKEASKFERYLDDLNVNYVNENEYTGTLIS